MNASTPGGNLAPSRMAVATKRNCSSAPLKIQPDSKPMMPPQSRRLFWVVLPLFLSLHLAAQPAPPTNSSNPWLNSWSFADTNRWASDLGYFPLSFTNLSVSTNGPGNSLLIDSRNESQLVFGTWNSDSSTNLNVTANGSLMFWFNPDWTSVSWGGAGPGGDWSALIDIGEYTSNADYGSWSCGFDYAGNNFYFITQDANGHEGDYIYAPVKLEAGTWNLIALAWSSTNSTFYLNGAYVTNGPGVAVLPSPRVISNGFAIGSDAATGLLQMHGAMTDLTTYNYQLNTSAVNGEWALYGVYYFGYEQTPDLSPGQFTPEVSPVFNAVTGSGCLLTNATNTTNCTSSNVVWIANPTATVSNGAVNLTFTISGGYSGLAYDIFATTELTQPLTNGTWYWMGQGYQCGTYTIPCLTNSDVYLLLGTPQSSYGNGLTDAYELLVLHQNPANGSKSGDGMLDGWKVLWGMNPLINNSAQPSERANYTYDGTGRLEANSGVSFTGFSPQVFGFDAEGSITNDQR
jgi:hypothetical protein